MTEIIIILIIILILYLIFIHNKYTTVKTENYDVYRNHDMGSYDVYKSGFLNQYKEIKDAVKDGVKETALIAKYDWNQKDVLGNTVYDRYYEAFLREKESEEFTERAADYDLDNIYDTKFSLLDNETELSTYSKNEMVDTPVETTFNGEKIYLSQKQY